MVLSTIRATLSRLFEVGCIFFTATIVRRTDYKKVFTHLSLSSIPTNFAFACLAAPRAVLLRDADALVPFDGEAADAACVAGGPPVKGE